MVNNDATLIESSTIVDQVRVRADCDLHMSRLIYGTWRINDSGDNSPTAVLNRIKLCLSLGITTFDLADIYGGGNHQAETTFGQALRLDPTLRTKMQLVSKCDIRFPNPAHPDVYVKHYDTSAAYIKRQVQDTLTAVGTEYLDLLLIHRPDPLMDATEVAQAMIELRNAGQCRYFGVSNFSVSQVRMLQSRLPFPLVTNQIECSVLAVQAMYDGVLDQCQELQMTPMIWSPLAGGRLFGGGEEGGTAEESQRVKRVQQALQRVAKELNSSVDQVAFAWLLRHPARMLPIVGSNDSGRIESACGAMRLQLTRQQWFSILEASNGREVA